MGCGASKVPAIILPDPQPDVEWKALIKRQNMIGFDFNVFQDFDEKKKWLFIDKKGSLFKGPKYILENFVREPGKKEGQCLCAAKIPLEDVHVKIYGVETHEDSDDSDGYSDDSADEATTTVKVTTMKWAQTLKAKFYRDRSFENKFAELKVKAKGKAKKKEVTESENEQSKTSVTITKKVKKMFYTLNFEDGRPPVKIEIEGKLNTKENQKWKCEMFEAESVRGPFIREQCRVTSKSKEPALAMMLGYLCVVELSPQDIADNVIVW